MPRTRVRPSILALGLLALLAALPSSLFAGSKLDGHWEGSIQIPGNALAFNLDFKTDDGGAIVGDISIPAQSLQDRALVAVSLDGDRAKFAIADIPGNPTFDGALSADGAKIEGKFTQGGATLDFALSRATGAADRARTALADFPAFAERAVAAWNVPGTAIAVVVEDEVVLAQGFGVRDVESKAPMTADSLFAIGSTSKAFTTAVLGMLVDEGKLDWDEPLRKYLPEFRLKDPLTTELMTPRDLVTHRSGLPRHDLLWYNNNNSTRAELVAALAHVDATASLRQRYQYNNLMFLTAGDLAERLTGKTWEEVVRERILAPLGMTRTTFDVHDSQKDPDFAQPHRETDDGKLERIPFRDISLIGPAGSINSSVSEMSRWLRFHLDGGKVDGHQLIRPATLADLHAPQMAIPAPPSRADISSGAYAMGWVVDTYRGHRRLAHGGGIDGFITSVTLFPDDRVGVVSFTNVGSGLPSVLAQHAADRVLGLEPIDWNGEGLERRKVARESAKTAEAKLATTRREGTQPSHPVADYRGEYQHPGYGTITIGGEGDRLAVTYHEIAAPLEHWHYDVWSGADTAGTEGDPTFEDIKFQFQGDLDGNVARLAIPLESAVAPIVFRKKAAAKMSDPAFLAGLVGRYQLSSQPVTVELSGTRLQVSLPGQPTYTLEPSVGDRFQLAEIPSITVAFSIDSAGRATALTFYQPDGVFEAQRIE